MPANKKAWFQELKAEFEKLAATSDFFREELKLLDERQRFSIYSDCNPIWLMDHNERAGIYMLLGLSKPQVVIEIGTRFAGSTSLFSELAEHVYVVDIDSEVERRCKPLTNVTVLIGDSSTIIPSLIDRLNDAHGGWDFALVDGDHSSTGVQNDLNALIANRPRRRAYVAMHDSFNPECRKGILEANWRLPWVHNLEVDFTIGNLMPQPHVCGTMWGGLALAEIGPEDRAGSLSVTQTGRLIYQAALRQIAHDIAVQQATQFRQRPLYTRIIRRAARTIGLRS